MNRARVNSRKHESWNDLLINERMSVSCGLFNCQVNNLFNFVLTCNTFTCCLAWATFAYLVHRSQLRLSQNVSILSFVCLF